MARIPERIHQSWKTSEIPTDVYDPSWVASWQQAHPHWEHHFWTDQDNEQLVRQHYAEFLDGYLALSPAIKKADFSRFLYMHRYGGVYADLDFVCLRHLSPLLADYDIVLGQLSPDNDWYQIPNAFMASRPGLEFWLLCAQDALNAPPQEQCVEMHAGPLRLQWAYWRYKPDNSAIIGDGLIYPFDWIHFTPRQFSPEKKRLAEELRRKSPAEMAAAFPRSYCLTFWTHNW